MQEMKPYCSGNDVSVCPLNYQGYGEFEERIVSNTSRIFRSSTPDCINRKNWKKMIKECDKGSISWTKWLSWSNDKVGINSTERSRRRFCHLESENCLFEEKEQNICCHYFDECESGQPCFGAVLM